MSDAAANAAHRQGFEGREAAQKDALTSAWAAAQQRSKEIAQAETRRLTELAKGLSVETTRAYIDGYRGDISPDEYNRAFRGVYEAARDGLSYEQISRSAPVYMEQLGPEGSYLAFDRGEGEYRGSKKGSLSTATDERASVNTPEATSGTTPYSKVSQIGDDGNRKIRYSLRDDGQGEAERLETPDVAEGMEPEGNGAERNDTGLSFAQQVDEVAKGKYNSQNMLLVCGTPPVLQEVGLNALPVTITPKHVKNIMGTQSNTGNAHGLGEMIKQLPEALKRPVMVIESATKAGSSVVVITQLTDSAGNSVVVPVVVDGTAQYNGLGNH